MSSKSDEKKKLPNIVDMLNQASSGRAPKVELMPRATHRLHVRMRDGVELDTWVWLPFDRPGPYPTILVRTPYKEELMGWTRLGTLRYRDAGYAVVHQLIRGIGTSGGAFTFNSPFDRPDGYDTVEWIASQSWSNGAVGMDGSSYAGMTQLTTALTQPPHLKCIVPAVVSSDFFNHMPGHGGIFSRQHTLGWTQFTWAESLADIVPGLWGNAAMLANPDSWKRLLHRPAIEAVDGVLVEDRKQHFTDVLSHPVFDDWWSARTLMPEDYAKINVPTLVVTGLFDGSMGSQHLWHNLERHAPRDAERYLLVGPWDHGQAYIGGGRTYGPWDFGPASEFDLFGTRLAFFDKHLKGVGAGPKLPGRTTVFVTGANEWVAAELYPHPSASLKPLYLHSDGLANMRGHGHLKWDAPAAAEPHDTFQSDPSLPFVPVGASLDTALEFDLRETERQEDVLVYSTEPLSAPLTIFGEFVIKLHVSADVPDCDIVCWLADVPPDGKTRRLAEGFLRMRFREGFDRQVFLTPGKPVEVTVRMSHVSHRVAAGDRLRLLIGSTYFPLLDPNPNTGGNIGTDADVRVAQQSVHHDHARPSHVLLPLLPT